MQRLLPVTGKRFSCFFVFAAHFPCCLFVISALILHAMHKSLTLFTYSPEWLTAPNNSLKNYRVSWAENFQVKIFYSLATLWRLRGKRSSWRRVNSSTEIKQTKNMDLQFSPLSSFFPHAFNFNFSLNVFLLPKNKVRENISLLFASFWRTSSHEIMTIMFVVWNFH